MSSKYTSREKVLADSCTKGGHTTELLQLLSALSPKRYTPRLYIISEGDRFSRAKAIEHEASWSLPHDSDGGGSQQKQQPAHYSFIELPRARKVHQSFLSAPASVVLALAACMRQFVWKRTELDVILMNGPGTCVPIVLTVYVQRVSVEESLFPASPCSLTRMPQFCGMHSPRLIYVESFARVRTLSLTAKLLRPFVDRFVLQWPQNPSVSGAEVHKSWLV